MDKVLERTVFVGWILGFSLHLSSLEEGDSVGRFGEILGHSTQATIMFFGLFMKTIWAS